MKISKGKLIYFGNLILLLLMLFQIPLQVKFTIFKNLDEIFPFLLMIWGIPLLYKTKGRIYFYSQKDKIIFLKLIICIILLLFIGMIGNIKYKYQSLSHV